MQQRDSLLVLSRCMYSPVWHPARARQSITKTHIHLIFGRLKRAGKVELGRPVADYLPEIGSGYAAATLQQVLDMDVTNSFSEGYEGVPYSPPPRPGEAEGYSRQEIAMGWRAPPTGERGFSMKEYVMKIDRWVWHCCLSGVLPPLRLSTVSKSVPFLAVLLDRQRRRAELFGRQHPVQVDQHGCAGLGG
eukprot:SAG22_NODE_101_length_20519_cov_15.588002_16_plen_190_part_00